jgi:hypothetical protein
MEWEREREKKKRKKLHAHANTRPTITEGSGAQSSVYWCRRPMRRGNSIREGETVVLSLVEMKWSTGGGVLSSLLFSFSFLLTVSLSCTCCRSVSFSLCSACFGFSLWHSAVSFSVCCARSSLSSPIALRHRLSSPNHRWNGEAAEDEEELEDAVREAPPEEGIAAEGDA